MQPIGVPLGPVPPDQLAMLQHAEIEALRAEVAMLKRKLAEAAGGKPKPLTAKERMKKMRSKRP
jgi:hypothetical protein